MIGVNVEEARKTLLKGGLVGIPTETVYGLGANGFSSESVLKIFKAKERPHFDPLILHFNSIDAVHTAVSDFPEKARLLAEKYWPGPLTLVLPKKEIVPDEVTSGLDSVAVRVPNHPLTLELLDLLPFPLAAPSANPFGYISPTSAQHVKDQLGEKIDYILDGGECTVGVESTIVSFLLAKPIILREGGLSREKIEAVIGSVNVQKSSSSRPIAPGMLESHYAPKVPLTLVPNLKEYLKQSPIKENAALLCFREALSHENCTRCIVLSQQGDVAEAAANLFKTLRELDNTQINHIYAEMVENVGIGRAVNDRLKRAGVF